MYKLYGSVGSGSASVEAALAEVGAKYSVIVISTPEGQHLTDDFQKINPRQQVPALVLPDGSVMTEGAAMLLHLADAFPAAHLAPLPGTSARAQHDRWLIFMAVNIYEAELRKAYSDRYSSQESGAEGVADAADAYIKRHYSILEDAASTGPYFFGEMLTMVDIYLWKLANWADPDWLSENCPKIKDIASTVSHRKPIRPVHATHFAWMAFAE